MFSSPTSKLKAAWTPAFHTVFIDLCVEEIAKGNRPGTHFTKEGWRNIYESFHEKMGVRYDKKQLKNHWDTTKEQWKILCKLTSTSNMKWDPITNTFGATEEDWANYIQAYPVAAQFQNKELPFVGKLEKIFDGTISAEKMLLPTRRRRKFDMSAVKTECLSRPDDVTVRCARKRKNKSGQSMASSPPAKVKANWTLTLHKLFIDVCLEQTLMGNKPGSHFTREGWSNIGETFRKKVGVAYESKQLKNHWTATRSQWKAWCKLIATSNMKWDPNSKTFGASEEDWANYTQGNPGAAQFRFNEIPFMDELRTLFDGTVVSCETEPPTKWGKHNDGSNTSEHGMVTVNDIVESRTPRRNESRTRGGNENPCDIVEARSGFTAQSIPQRFSYSIGECIECLDGMEEVEQGNDLYLFALDIFLKKEYREIFLQLKKPSLRIAWLKRLLSVVPTLH